MEPKLSIEESVRITVEWYKEVLLKKKTYAEITKKSDNRLY